MTTSRRLRRILGLGFGLAFVFGTMVGIGILRLPGMVAAAAGSPALIMVCWCIGGLYALMGAVSVSELAAAYPEAGGLRVYARRAFGEGAGFVVGWVDWLASVATLAYGAVAAVQFLATLWPVLAQYEGGAAVAILIIFGALHTAGVRIGGSVISTVSAATGILLLILIAACLLAHPVAHATTMGASTLNSSGISSSGALLAVVPAIRAILTAYDGWYAPVYTAEESLDSSRTLPRAIIGGALMVAALYLLINFALLRVLPIPVLAASTLPAAAAADVVLPHGSGALMTAISILIALNLINSNVVIAPRVLFSMAREGWIPAGVAGVNEGGTPQAALIATLVTSIAMILTGSFNQLIALFAVLILLNYVATFASVFVLRQRDPQAPRPYKALGYPFSTGVVLVGSLSFLIAALIEDWRSGVTAVLFLSLCLPAYALAARSRRARTPSYAAS
ncbi:MAG TPA: amino acid permease [Steroidobacteraceae bacterium]|nr:amino acid permease [Steroidobacteraceae bacterium]